MQTTTHKSLNRALRGAVTLAGLLALTGGSVFALPVDRAAGRQGAQNSRQDGREGAQDSRQTGRDVSQARRWNGATTLPAGYTPYRYGGYSYYRVGSVYYSPYFYGGRTVYIQVDVNGGYPAPPPPAGTINIYF